MSDGRPDDHPEPSPRTAPIIVITGTPGTGKTTHAQLLVDRSPVHLKHINVAELVKERKLYEKWDEEWQTYVVDEDKVIDEIEPLTTAGGLIIDWHTCDVFPERWVDLCVVLRCDHTMLWDRLAERNYPLKKIQENNESEIMQTILEDAQGSYAEEIVVELRSETSDDLEGNVTRLVSWIEVWLRDHPSERQETSPG